MLNILLVVDENAVILRWLDVVKMEEKHCELQNQLNLKTS